MRIPFDIKYRPQIESGEYKVENREGRPVRIICWDMKSEKKYGYHIVGLIEYGPQHEEGTYYTIDGKGQLKDKEPDLFLITPEPEMSEFEKAVIDYKYGGHDSSLFDPGYFDKARNEASELLDLARKELNRTIGDYGLGYSAGYIDGKKDCKAEALKDLPMWKPAAKAYDGDRLPRMDWPLNRLVDRFGEGIFYLDIGELHKLPRFKEEQK